MPRVLIAGLGSIGRRHLRNLRALGVDDLQLLRTRDDPVEEAPEVRVWTDLGAALAAGPDAVLVCNPTSAHLGVALPAVRDGGCHLFVEKPISHSWEGVRELIDAVDEKRVVAAVGYDLRFDPGLQRIRELLQEGRIGRVVGVQAQVGQYLPDWRPDEDYRRGTSARRETGGGVVLDLVHELDYLGWLLGPVNQVSCMLDRVSSLEIETEDMAAILLRFESGAIGSVHLDYVQRSASRTCRIIGEQGTVFWDSFERSVRWYEASERRWDVFEYREAERNDRFLAEMQHFLACVAGRELPAVDLRSGSRSLRLALAAKESARTGRSSAVKAFDA